MALAGGELARCPTIAKLGPSWGQPHHKEPTIPPLTHSVALVTGAAVRVGRAIALELAARGATLAVHYRSSREPAEALAIEITEKGGAAMCFQADLAQVADCERLAAEVVAAFGGVDVLVNNASEYFPTPWGEVSEADFDRLLSANLKGPFFLTQALTPTLKARRGCVINLTDALDERPPRRFGAYAASKAGLVGMTYHLARALAPEVRVNGVSPGPVLPPPDYDEALKEKVAKLTLLQRWGSAEAVAKTVAHLCEADYITGQLVAVDGGRRLK